MYSSFKPRFNRSNPKVVRGKDLRKGVQSGRLSTDQSSRWRPVSMKTLGYLAAKDKIGILQVHQCIGDKPNKAFAKSFLDNVNLYHPSERDMRQIHLFSHLLFA